MKMRILLLLLLPCTASAQNIALLDRNFKQPISVTHTVAADQLSHNLFPVYQADFDSVIQLIEGLVQHINNRFVPEAAMQLLPVGHSHVAITTESKGTSMAYTIYLSTRIHNLGASLAVVERGSGNRRAVQQLLLFLDYLKNNRLFVSK